MPVRFASPPNPFIVEMVFDGEITAADLRETTSAGIDIEKTDGVIRFLVDATGMVISASLLDVFEVPTRQFFDEGADRRSRLAIVMPTDPDSRTAVEFFETASTNRGWLVRAFDARRDAMEWLQDGLHPLPAKPGGAATVD